MTDKEKEKLEKLQSKIEQMKAQERAIIAKEKKRKQRENTRRLIQKGAIAEKYFGGENTSPEQLEKLLQTIISKLHIRPVLKLQFKVINTANKGDTQKMLALFVAVTILENLEMLYTAVYVFNKYPVF